MAVRACFLPHAILDGMVVFAALLTPISVFLNATMTIFHESSCADGSTEQPCLRLDNTKIRTELGLEFTPLKQTLLAQGNAFIEAGLLPEK